MYNNVEIIITVSDKNGNARHGYEDRITLTNLKVYLDAMVMKSSDKIHMSFVFTRKNVETDKDKAFNFAKDVVSLVKGELKKKEDEEEMRYGWLRKTYTLDL